MTSRARAFWGASPSCRPALACTLAFCSGLLLSCDRNPDRGSATVAQGDLDLHLDDVREQRAGARHDLTLRELLVISAGTDSAGEWAMSRPRAIVESSDGHIYVLDSDWKQVFVFDSSGALVRRIGGGYGTGDGEMLLPVDMDAHDEDLYVLDYELNRVIVFDRSGRFNRIVRLVEQGRYVAATASGIWIGLMHPRQGFMVDLYDSAGEQPLARIGLHATDTAYIEAGVGGNIGALPDGGIVYVHGSGAFLQFADAGATERIVPVGPLPDWKYEKNPPQGLAPLYFPHEVAYGVIAWGSQHVMVLRRELDSPEGSTTLTVIDDGGAVEAEGVFVGLGEVLSLDAGVGAGTVFLTFLDPPRIIKYQVDIKVP